MRSIEDQAANILEKGADLFETGELEWIQGAMRHIDQATGKTTASCLVGCVNHVMHGHVRNDLSKFLAGTDVLASTIYDALAETIGSAFHAMWNDGRGRTKAEVIDAMKSAAKDLRNRADGS